jgi:hypothetical protein
MDARTSLIVERDYRIPSEGIQGVVGRTQMRATAKRSAARRIHPAHEHQDGISIPSTTPISLQWRSDETIIKYVLLLAHELRGADGPVLSRAGPASWSATSLPAIHKRWEVENEPSYSPFSQIERNLSPSTRTAASPSEKRPANTPFLFLMTIES